jgi:pimeloyl-ACP methyl ester carboxylesterase
VRDQLGLEFLNLLGRSHGGFVAMAWAGTNPGRVGRLVLAGTAPRFTDVIRRARMDRVASHQGQPYFEDALAALLEQQAGKYGSDEQLAALYERAAQILAPLGEDITPVADAFRAAGLNADALKHFNKRVAPTMDLRPLPARIQAPTLVISLRRGDCGRDRRRAPEPDRRDGLGCRPLRLPRAGRPRLNAQPALATRKRNSLFSR